MKNHAAKPASGPDPQAVFSAQTACLIFALAAITMAVYLPVKDFEFTNYDDPEYITENWHVQAGLTWEGVRWAFGTGYLGNWLPLTWLSHMLDVSLFGPGPAGPHLVNALLHSANSVLVFLLLLKLTGMTWRSAFVAALFALHPLRVESVAWACERRDVLSAFFGLLSLIAYVQYARAINRQNAASPDPAGADSKVQRFSGSTVRYCLTLFLFALALMSKPMLVTLPFAMLLLDWWPLNRFNDSTIQRFNLATFGRLVLEKFPFFVLAIACAALTVHLQKAAGAVSPLGWLPLPVRIENMFVSYARYLGKLVWPTDLALPYLQMSRWKPEQVALAALLVATLTVAAVWTGRRFRFVPVGWFWFVGMLFPVIGIVQAGPQAMADRFVYLPALGVFVIFAWGAGEFFARRPVPQPFLWAGAALIIGACAWRTADQLKYWRDTETLFKHTLAVMPQNYVALNNLGVLAASKGRTDEAIQLYNQALEINPNDSQTLNNLGNALNAKRQYQAAIAALEAALRLTPARPEIHVNLGTALVAAGRTDDAIASFERALQLRPDYPDALNNLANALTIKGRHAEAIGLYQQVIRRRPKDAGAHYNLGNALALNGQLDQAIAAFREALRLNPENPDAWNNLGDVLASQGRWTDAEKCYREVLRWKPNDAGAHTKLGRALVGQGRLDEAESEFLRALQLDQDNVEAHFDLGRMLAGQGRRDDAIAHLLHVIRLQPDHPGASNELAGLGVRVRGR